MPEPGVPTLHVSLGLSTPRLSQECLHRAYARSAYTAHKPRSVYTAPKPSSDYTAPRPSSASTASKLRSAYTAHKPRSVSVTPSSLQEMKEESIVSRARKRRTIFTLK